MNEPYFGNQVQRDLDGINKRYKSRQRQIFWSLATVFAIGLVIIYLLLKGVL